MDRKKPENSEEKYYKQIVNLAKVAIVKFDKELNITDFTGNSEIIFGFKKKEVIGKSLYTTIVPQFDTYGKDLKKLIDGIIANIKSYKYNVNENITKDGTRIWMQWYNSEIRDEKNELSGVLSIGIDVTDRINTEVALKESEERFKTLSDLTFEGILIHDNGVILDCNLSFERQIGYTREELLGMQVFGNLIPKEFQKFIEQNKKAHSLQYEAEAILKDGTIIPISLESRNIKIENKNLRVAAVRNISELKKTIKELDAYKCRLEEIVRKRTEELKHKSNKLKKQALDLHQKNKLLEAQQKEGRKQAEILRNQNIILENERNLLRTLIDNIPDYIYIKDQESRFLTVNKRLLHVMHATTLDEIIGKTDYDLTPSQEAADLYFKDERRIITTGKAIINKEEIGFDESDQERVISTTKVPYYDTTGNIAGIVGIGRDVTEKIITENKLLVQSKHLEESNNLLAERTKKIENLNGELLEINKRLEYANYNLQERKEELETTLEQLKKTQSHLVQSEKMASLGVLMAGIAHEINNPVNFIYAGVNSIIKDFEDVRIVIEGFNSLDKTSQDIVTLISKIKDLKKTHEFDLAYTAITETLQDIKLGATRIKEIVNGLSRFLRMENEDWKSANLHEEIDNVLVLLKNRYKHHIEIIKDYDESLPLVECYPGKLNQVFMNLINNAVDAIEKEQGTIIIKTSYNADRVNVSIKDTGKGIRDDIKLKIFDPFFTTKEVGNGLGLGLAISYSIVQEHHGEIIVDSELNKGTEFIVRIPIIQLKTNFKK